MECKCEEKNPSCKHYNSNCKSKCNLEEDEYEGWLDSLYSDHDLYDNKPNDFSDI